MTIRKCQLSSFGAKQKVNQCAQESVEMIWVEEHPNHQTLALPHELISSGS